MSDKTPGFSLFGYALVRNKDEEKSLQNQPTFSPKEEHDGALVVAPGGAYGSFVDLNGTTQSDAELITRYRGMAESAEVDSAVEEIVNAMVRIDEEDCVKLDLDDVPATDAVKDAVDECFSQVVKLMNFNQTGHDTIRRWYVDARLNFHMVIDKTKPDEGIKELRYIDPRKIRKIREVVAKKTEPGAVGQEPTTVETRNEYFVYNPKGFNFSAGLNAPITSTTASGVRIANDAIAYVTSGLTSADGKMVLGYLHKAIKPLNMLRAVEDSSVIYRLARAPERRVWYIDVGNLPKAKAEQYVRDIMTRHKNKLTYDVQTGEYRDDRKMMTMLEDYWLPRRESSKGTEVTTLPGGENLGQMDDVLYFQKKLYASLNVPMNRLDSDSPFTLGKSEEISNEEVKFGLFVSRLRTRFGQLFTRVLERQVVLRGVMSVEDFRRIGPLIKYDFAHDNHFLELKEHQLNQARADAMEAMAPWVGRYFSNEWVNHNIWHLTEQEIEEEREKIMEEESDYIYSKPMPGQEQPGMDPMAMDMGPGDLAGGGGAPGDMPPGMDDPMGGSAPPGPDGPPGAQPPPEAPKTKQSVGNKKKKPDKAPPGREKK